MRRAMYDATSASFHRRQMDAFQLFVSWLLDITSVDELEAYRLLLRRRRERPSGAFAFCKAASPGKDAITDFAHAAFSLISTGHTPMSSPAMPPSYLYRAERHFRP